MTLKMKVNYTETGQKWELLASIADSLVQMAMQADILRAAAMYVNECTPELNALEGTLLALFHVYHDRAGETVPEDKLK